jgi:hypothetical protein
LGKVKLKDLRNSQVALLGEAGEHPQVVSERVGHAGFTLREYGKAFSRQHRQAADRVGQLLAAGAEEDSAEDWTQLQPLRPLAADGGSAPTGASSGA